jgi:ABC-type bacteriocin/lantibiotic exporter with double-glycine peptidase domain
MSQKRDALNALASVVDGGASLFDRRAWGYFAQYYRAASGGLALYALIASAQSLLVLPVLYCVRFAFDVAIPRGDIRLLLLLGAGIFMTRVANSAVSLYMRRLIVRIIKRAVMALRCDLVARLYALSREYYSGADVDRLHTRVVQDTERVDNMSNSLLSATLPAILTSAALMIVLLFLNWSLVLLIAAAVPILFFATRITSRYVKNRVFDFQRAFEGFSKGMLFVLRHMDLTRAQGFEREELARQRVHLDRLRESGEAMSMSYALHYQIETNVTGMTSVVILIAGGIAIAEHVMSLGEFLAFYVAAGLLNGFVERVIGAVPDLIAGNESLVTLRLLYDAGPLEPYHGTRPIEFGGALALDDVTFAYGEHAVLRDLSLDIRPGDNIAIVGANGAGKSTILSLIIGFARPRSGRVLADGLPYDELDMRALRRSIGVVMQSPTLFSGTVIENIGYGRHDIGRAEIVAAARRALASDFIESLPNGYDTEIGEGGVRLSGGECQRLAIARALVGRPRLLILDEPTNHLDQGAVNRLMVGLVDDANRPAILTISHDPEVVRFADRVFKLERGRLSLVRPRISDAALGS